MQKKDGQKKFYKKLTKMDPMALRTNLILMMFKDLLELLRLNHLQKFLCIIG